MSCFPPLIIAAIFGVEEADLYGLSFGAPLLYRTVNRPSFLKVLDFLTLAFGILVSCSLNQFLCFLLSLVFIAPVRLISNDVLILFFGNQWRELAD